MLFSIVIPVFNVEEYLDECMQSVLSQVETIKNDCEILLIDDGSTDRSGEICDKYKEVYHEIVKVFHKDNEGLLATRRFGYKKVSGEYIINCDSDDLLEYGMLQKIKNIIVQYDNPDIVIFNYNNYNRGEKNIAYQNILSNKHDSLVEKKDVLREYMSGHTIVSVCGKVYKSSCIDVDKDYTKYGRLSTGEDTLQTLEFFSNANTFVYLNEALYDYRSGSGMTANFDKNYYFTFKSIFKEILKQKKDWNLKDFDKLFAIKILQTAGRAITQSRYNKWTSFMEQKSYLELIREDEMFDFYIQYIGELKRKMQMDHYMLLKLLKHKFYALIILLLRMKNILDGIKNK